MTVGKVKILSKDMFIRDVLPNVNKWENSCFISILEPDDETPLKEDCKNYLTVDFYDLGYDIDNYKTITEEQAEKIFNFIKSNSDKETFYVHCYAGVSRSGAVGAFIHEYFGGAYKDLLKEFPNILPNGRVTKLLRAYERMDADESNNLKINFI